MREQAVKLFAYLRRWYDRQPLPLKILLVISPLLLGKLVDEFLKDSGRAMGLADWQVAGLIVGCLVLLALGTLPFHRDGPDEPLPPIRFDDLEERRSFPRAELEKIRTGLHQRLYQGTAPLGDEITGMYAKNPVMGVGLFDPARNDYVAFATGWPLTDAAAARLISGEMDENELTAADVLPQSRNSQANFVLVPAFGADGRDGSNERKYLGLRLFHAFQRTLRRNFFPAGDRPLTIVATGFSPEGRKWCRGKAMEERCVVHLSDDHDDCPVFTKRIGLADVD